MEVDASCWLQLNGADRRATPKRPDSSAWLTRMESRESPDPDCRGAGAGPAWGAARAGSLGFGNPHVQDKAAPRAVARGGL
jgi:hypothetical protein